MMYGRASQSVCTALLRGKERESGQEEPLGEIERAVQRSGCYSESRHVMSGTKKQTIPLLLTCQGYDRKFCSETLRHLGMFCQYGVREGTWVNPRASKFGYVNEFKEAAFDHRAEFMFHRFLDVRSLLGSYGIRDA